MDMHQLRIEILVTSCVDFEIFFEHPISEPIVAEDFEVAGDEEDEAYKPPPEGYELSSDNDSGRRKNVKKKTRIKKVMTPTKKSSPKKKGCKTPTKNGTPNMDTDGLVNDDIEGAVSGQGETKKSSRKYAGKKKQKSRSNFGSSSSGSGPNCGPSSSRSQSKSDAGLGSGEPIIEEVDSEDGKEYVYESEAFVSPISSDEDDCNRMEEFREALKDYFVFKGK
ncbi:hypothetical protein PIB30_050934 [Stylosanthes scabra]|uniref:Uncharacterized protein n=1 Tax=Stylosanthes scabra TaxID=79078 RepID=A0ABU6SHU3_9FABA|nr:hypothetical protein [Stylosanthes scabra]